MRDRACNELPAPLPPLANHFLHLVSLGFARGHAVVMVRYAVAERNQRPRNSATAALFPIVLFDRPALRKVAARQRAICHTAAVAADDGVRVILIEICSVREIMWSQPVDALRELLAANQKLPAVERRTAGAQRIAFTLAAPPLRLVADVVRNGAGRNEGSPRIPQEEDVGVVAASEVGRRNRKAGVDTRAKIVSDIVAHGDESLHEARLILQQGELQAPNLGMVFVDDGESHATS
eukprot:587303-Prymnesium_polylepis.1